MFISLEFAYRLACITNLRRKLLLLAYKSCRETSPDDMHGSSEVRGPTLVLIPLQFSHGRAWQLKAVSLTVQA